MTSAMSLSLYDHCELDPRGALPFLRLKNMARVWSMKDEAFKAHLAHSTNFRPRLQDQVEVVADAIGPFKEPHTGIEVRAILR